MPHSYTQNIVHIVFSTKDRRKIISADLRPKLWAYTAGICIKHEIHVDAIGGIDDHVHLLLRIPASLPLAKAVVAIKSNSSKWANEQGHKFAWQEGYAAFSVSASNVRAVVQYIQTQDLHHKKMPFEAEFAALLKKHGVKFDSKFIFG